MDWNEIKHQPRLPERPVADRTRRKEPPTNVEKWSAQKFHGIDADYIPGFDDGEQPQGALEASSH
jgi:hypothetical protein